MRRLVTILAATAAVGCAAPGPRAPAPVAPVTGAPAATFRVLNHLAWPFRLARLVLVADGQVVRSEVFAKGAAPSSIALSIPVAPGEHVLQIVAETQVSLTPGGPECAARLKSSTPFVADEAIPAEIRADLYLRPPPRPFTEQLDVKIDVRGARRDAWIARRLPAADEARCRPLRAPDRAVCRVEAMVAEARRQRDVIKLVCNHEKLAQMRVLARMRDEAASRARLTATPEGAPAEPQADVAEQRDRVLVLEQTMEALGREAEQCVGEEPIFYGGPMVTVDEACFEEALPPVDREPWTR